MGSKIPNGIIFGKGKRTRLTTDLNAIKTYFYGTPLRGVFEFDEDDKAVILFENGAIIIPGGLVTGGPENLSWYY